VKHSFWQKLKHEIGIWQVAALPGVVVIGIVVIARLTGSLQVLEWMAFDRMLRLRPAEPMDQRVVIVGINEADIRRIGTYPIPDREIASLLQTIQTYRPQVIGLDIFRDLPVPHGDQTGHAALVQAFQQFNNVIAIEKVLPDQSGETVLPPPTLPPEQVGTADAIFDADGALRRYLLGTADLKQDYHLSLSIRLAERYLSSRGITLGNSKLDPEAMRFGSVELTRVQPNTGGYVGADAGGNQMLLNFHRGCTPFRRLSFHDIQARKIDPNWLQGRIVLIGITAPSVKDTVTSTAIACSTPALTYGIEIQAHAVSQIISAVLDQRPLIHTWREGWEYLWIVAWGISGISLGRVLRSLPKLLLGVAIAVISLVGICYIAMIWGWWLPVVPACLTLVLNGTGLAAALFYRHEQDLRSRLKDQEEMIKDTSAAIHNGPTQRLKLLLQKEANGEFSSPQMFAELRLLLQELKLVHDSVEQEITEENHQLSLISDRQLDLRPPLHEILQEIYDDVLNRDFPYFKTIKIKVVTFEALDERYLYIKHKRRLCRFFEEALCNVGKHAVGVKRLEVLCRQVQGQNVISVSDDGIGYILNTEATEQKGLGTRQAERLAQQLHGTFLRSPNCTGGITCKLSWVARKLSLWQTLAFYGFNPY
jgi:CHASE2 domain-containing sensor protein/two-component sensor histidine kinase